MAIDHNACDFSSGQFLLGLTSKGLTNQRLAVVTYQLLAGALNRTLVLPSIRAGNVPMCRGAKDRDACMARLPFSALYDVSVLRSRLARPFRACCCASEALELGRYDLGSSFRLTRETARRVPLSWPAAQAYAARRAGRGTAAASAQLLLLSEDAWVDFGGVDGVDLMVLAVDRALVFAPEIRRVAKLVLTSLRSSGRRLTWLHFRVESDWKGYGSACPYHDSEAILRKVAGSLEEARSGNGTNANGVVKIAAAAISASPSGGAAGAAPATGAAAAAAPAAAALACGSVPPSRGDLVYVAGGVKHASTLAVLATLFGGGVHSGADHPAAAAFVAERGNATALHELNLFGAAIDFMVGLGASTWIVPSCSTFSSECLLLAHLGRQRPPASAWTYAGDPRGPRLQPFMCDGHSAHMAPRHLAYHAWPRAQASAT